MKKWSQESCGFTAPTALPAGTGVARWQGTAWGPGPLDAGRCHVPPQHGCTSAPHRVGCHNPKRSQPAGRPLGNRGFPKPRFGGSSSRRGREVLGARGFEQSMASGSQMSLTRCPLPAAACWGGDNTRAAARVCPTRFPRANNKIFQYIKGPELDWFRYAVVLCYQL